MSQSRRRSATASPAPAPDLAPVLRSFPQARARATYESLLEAARDVFAERGFDDTQTPDIAARAAVSVGTFYRYFRDKRQVFLEMIAHHLANAYAEVAAKLTPERFSGADRRQTIDVALEVVFAQIVSVPKLHHVYLAMSLRDPEVSALRTRFERQSERLIADLIAVFAPREVIPDPRAAAHVILVAALEVALGFAGLHGPLDQDLNEQAVRAALREMIYRYVFP